MIETAQERDFGYSRLQPVTKRSEQYWYNLGHSGFDVELEVDGILRRYQESGFDFAYNETKRNVLGFIDEYIAHKVILTTSYKFKEVNGQQVMVQADSELPILAGIREEERFGQVYEAFSEIEDRFRDGFRGVAAFTSPPGWSGLKDRVGRVIEYPDTQTFAIRYRGDGIYRLVTLVSDASYYHNLEFLKRFGKTDEELNIPGQSYHQRLSQIVRQVVFYDSSENEIDDYKIMVKRMADAMGTSLIRTYEVKDRIAGSKRQVGQTVEEAYSALEDLQIADYEAVAGVCQDILANFREDLERLLPQSHLSQARQLIKIKLAETLVKINRVIKGEQAEQVLPDIFPTIFQEIRADLQKEIEYYQNPEIARRYAEDVREIERLAGCGGGGLESDWDFGFSTFSSSGEVYISSYLRVGRRGRGRRASRESGVCKICKINQVVKGGCGYCKGCEHKAG